MLNPNRPTILTRSIHRASALSLAAAVAAVLAGASSASAQSSGAFTISGSLGTGNSDALVGLSTTKTYLDAYNLGEAVNLTINGVLFTGVAGTNPLVTGVFSTTGLTAAYPGGGTNPGGVLGSLTNKFVYGSQTESFTYANLVVGQTYVVTFYNRSWDAVPNRVQNLTASGASVGAAAAYDEDAAAGQGNLNLLRYTFQAASTSQTLSFVALVAGNTDHQYGFTLEQTFNNTWTGGANWTSSTWSGGAAVAPNLAGSNANFTAQAAPTTIDLDANRTVGHIQFDGANAWTIGSAVANTLTLQADIGGAATLSALSGSHTITPNITLSSPTLLKLGAGTITLSGNITAGASTVQVGGGNLTLAGTNTYTGETLIGNGTLEVKTLSDYGVASAIGARTFAQENTTITGVGLHFQGGTLKFTGSTAQSTNRNIRILNGATGAAIDASGTNPGATLSFTHTGANMNLFDTGGTRTLTLKGSNTGANTFAIKLDDQAATATSLTKDGVGKWVLSATDSTFTGGVTVTAGDLWITRSSALGAGTKTISLNNGTAGNPALHLDGTAGSITLPTTFSYATSNTSTATSASIVNEAGTNTVGGNVTLTSGGGSTRLLSNAGKITFTGNLSANQPGRELYLRGDGDGEISGVISNGTTVNLPVFKDSGSGTWTLSNAASTYTGATTVTAGTLAVSALANGGAASSIGASSSAETNLILGNATLRYTGGSVTSDRAFTINGGTSATLDVSNVATSLALNGATGAASNGALTKTGAGTLILAGANTYTGATSISAGTLRVGGSLDAGSLVSIANGANLSGGGTIGGGVSTVSGAHIAPGASVGTLTVGSVSLVPGAILDFEFNGSPANDQVIISNAAGLTINGGGFNLYAEGGTTTWTTNGTYTLLDYNTSFAGSAGNLTILNAQAGKYYSIADDNGAATAIKLTIADATQSEWQANPGDSQWTTGGNWNGGTPNAGGVVAKFGSIPTSATAVSVNGAKTVGGVVFDNTNSYTVSGGAGDTITLDNGVASASIAVTNGTHTLAAPLALTGNLSATAASGTALTISGNISGASKGVIVTGLGTVTLSGNNTYGLTTITNATLQIGAGGTRGNLGSGDVTMSGGATLAFNRSDDITVANNLLGTNTTLTKLGAGKLTLTGTNSAGGGVTGTVRINSGTLQLGSAGALPSGINLTTSGGTLDLNGFATTAISLAGASGTITDNSGVAGTTTFTLNQTGPTTYGGDLTNGATRSLNFVLGSGTLTLTGNLSASATSIASGAGLIFDRATDATVLTNISGAGAQVTKLGAGTLTLSGTNTFATGAGGGLNLNAGTVKLAGPAALATGVALGFNGGTLELNGNDVTSGFLTGASGTIVDNGAIGASTFNVIQSATTTFSGTINDGANRTVALTKDGTGSLTLAGANANTFRGTTTVKNGTLILQKSAGNAVVGPITIGDTVGSDVLQLGAADQISNTSVVTFNSGGSGNSAFFRLNGFNETVQGIQTTVGNAAVLENNSAIAGTATLTVDTAGNNYTYDGIVRDRSTGSGTFFALTKAGNGTLTLADTAGVAFSTWTGPTLINAGKLVIENNGGTMPTPITNNSATPDALTFNQVIRGVTVSGTINGSGGLTKLGTNALTLSSTNSYAGTTLLSGGSLVAAAGGGAALPGNVTIGNGVQAGIFLIMGAANQFGPNSVITWNNGPSDAKLELRGFNQTVAGIQSDADDTLSIIQNQETGTPGAATLTINNTADYIFNGLIRNQAGGAVNLVKNGPGTQEIRNVPAQADNFGTLTINAGKFTINFSGANNSLGAGTSVSVGSGATLGLDGTWDMNRAISGQGTVLKQGTGDIIISGAQSYAALNANAGTTTLTTSLPGAAISNGGGILNLNADAAGSTVTSNATTNFGSRQTLAALNVGAAGVAKLALHTGGPANIAPMDTSALSITAGGKFDLTNNVLVVRGGTFVTLRNQVASGFNGGSWNGAGINSSTATNDPLGLTAVGVASNVDLGYSAFGNVNGLTGNEILVKTTYYGDNDLSGTVTTDDFSLFLDGFTGAAPASWLNGDYDYDGVVTTDDFSLFLASLTSGAPALSASGPAAGGGSNAGAPAAVPEPGSIGLLFAGALGLLSRRRRKP